MAMKKLTKEQIDRYRSLLKVDRVERVSTSSAQGALGMLALAAEVEKRLQSTGGRPTIADWDIKRPIPLRSKDWNQLRALGEKLGISPAQCAALLLEKALQILEEDEEEELRKAVG